VGGNIMKISPTKTTSNAFSNIKLQKSFVLFDSIPFIGKIRIACPNLNGTNMSIKYASDRRLKSVLKLLSFPIVIRHLIVLRI
jgi:hypothetical protein